MRIFVDTSALLALLDEDDLHHREASELFRGAIEQSAHLLTHNYILVEALTLARRRLGSAAADRLADAYLPVLTTIWIDEPLHRAALAAQRATGSSVSFVDRVSFEVMRREGIQQALAFDTDFETAGFSRPVVPRGPGSPGRLSETVVVYGAAGADVAATSDLVSVAEIAARAGRSVNTIQSWRRRHADFPAPVASLAAGPVWTWAVVQRWIRSRKVARRSPDDITAALNRVVRDVGGAADPHVKRVGHAVDTQW